MIMILPFANLCINFIPLSMVLQCEMKCLLRQADYSISFAHRVNRGGVV